MVRAYSVDVSTHAKSWAQSEALALTQKMCGRQTQSLHYTELRLLRLTDVFTSEAEEMERCNSAIFSSPKSLGNIPTLSSTNKSQQYIR